jgi:hypothetical protein
MRFSTLKLKLQQTGIENDDTFKSAKNVFERRV